MFDNKKNTRQYFIGILIILTIFIGIVSVLVLIQQFNPELYEKLRNIMKYT